jgi:hypothetical protein
MFKRTWLIIYNRRPEYSLRQDSFQHRSRIIHVKRMWRPNGAGDSRGPPKVVDHKTKHFYVLVECLELLCFSRIYLEEVGILCFDNLQLSFQLLYALLSSFPICTLCSSVLGTAFLKRIRQNIVRQRDGREIIKKGTTLNARCAILVLCRCLC